MSDDFGVQGLNGNEVIDDILGQLKKRLLGDCNLRPSDSYSRGYSAKITYSVSCYGLDKQLIDGESVTGVELDEEPDELGDGEIVIEQEENLTEVRDRIDEAKREDGEVEPESEDPDPEQAAIIRKKRKYTRKVQLAAVGVDGGAEDFKE